jgi:hypothetical protein
MTQIKHRVQYTELTGAQQTRTAQDAIVYGDIAAVQAYLDERTWAADLPLTITEYVGSDAAGRILPDGIIEA